MVFETSRISSDEDWLMISNNEVFRMKNEVVPVCIRWFESNKLGDFASSSLKGEERRHLRGWGPLAGRLGGSGVIPVAHIRNRTIAAIW